MLTLFLISPVFSVQQVFKLLQLLCAHLSLRLLWHKLDMGCNIGQKRKTRCQENSPSLSLMEETVVPVTAPKEFASLGSIQLLLLLICGKGLMFTEDLYALGPLHMSSRLSFKQMYKLDILKLRKLKSREI